MQIAALVAVGYVRKIVCCFEFELSEDLHQRIPMCLCVWMLNRHWGFSRQ